MDCTEIIVKRALTKSGLENVNYALNPYTGCSHRCIYCYSPYVLRMDPRDFWSNVKAKINVPFLLQGEIKKIKGNVFIGSVTDPYQPCEKKYEITRKSIKLLINKKIYFSILTKSDLILRDLDLINNYKNVEVGFTLNTLDENSKIKLEINSPPPEKILYAISKIRVKKYVMIAPLYLNIDKELDVMLETLSKMNVDYVLLDKFRFREGMPENLKEYFFKDENKIKDLARRLSAEKNIKVYFSF
jgi:DNA repair photolyase